MEPINKQAGAIITRIIPEPHPGEQANEPDVFWKFVRPVQDHQAHHPANYSTKAAGHPHMAIFQRKVNDRATAAQHNHEICTSNDQLRNLTCARGSSALSISQRGRGCQRANTMHTVAATAGGALPARADTTPTCQYNAHCCTMPAEGHTIIHRTATAIKSKPANRPYPHGHFTPQSSTPSSNTQDPSHSSRNRRWQRPINSNLRGVPGESPSQDAP